MSTVNFSEELIKRDFIEKYLSSSTPEVYGATKNNIKNHIYKPSTPYAASKLAGELHLMTMFYKNNFPVVFTRAADIYGVHPNYIELSLGQ